MKFRKVPNTRTKLEEFMQVKGLRPVGVADYKNKHIFLAETDLEKDNINEYPFGYYQVAWFITDRSAEKIQTGRWLDFDAFHDSDRGWTQETKRSKRVQAAIEDAKQFADKYNA